MRQTSVDSEVNYVAAPKTEGGKPTIAKGKIVQVISQGSARIELSENNHAIADYSDGGEVGTFHYPDETKAVKAADTFGDKPQPSAPATNGAAAK